MVLCYPSKRQDYDSDEFTNSDFGNEEFGNDFFGAESNTFEKFESQAVHNGAHAGGKGGGHAGAGGHAKGVGHGGIGGGSQAGGGGDRKVGYSAGSGLRSIAQGSAEQANTAVLNQDAAGHQAAYVAKNTLAQAANAVSTNSIQNT